MVNHSKNEGKFKWGGMCSEARLEFFEAREAGHKFQMLHQLPMTLISPDVEFVDIDGSVVFYTHKVYRYIKPPTVGAKGWQIAPNLHVTVPTLDGVVQAGNYKMKVGDTTCVLTVRLVADKPAVGVPKTEAEFQMDNDAWRRRFEDRDVVAKMVYTAMRRAAGQPSVWIDDANSEMQNEARSTAVKIISLFHPPT